MSYREWIETWVPPWLRRTWGARFVFVPALLSDAVLEAARQAVRARFVREAPTDALLEHAADRVLEPGLVEDTETLRARIIGAWTAWAKAGTGEGLLEQLRAWLPGGVWELIANDEWSVIPPGRLEGNGLVAIDGEHWTSRLWVLLGQPHPWQSEGAWGDPGDWGDGGTWGSTAKPWQVEAVRRIVRKWKAGDEYIPEIIVLLSGELWDWPEGEWDEGGGTWDGEAARWE